MGTVFGRFQLDVSRLRLEMGMTQRQFSEALGISLRALHSYEQGWRTVPSSVERLLLLYWIVHRNGWRLNSVHCWELKECDAECRQRCYAHITGQGHLCWLLTGTMCGGERTGSWVAKRERCSRCEVMQTLLAGDQGLES